MVERIGTNVVLILKNLLLQRFDPCDLFRFCAY